MLRENCRILHYQNVLLGSAVLAALTFGFVSCSSEDEDEHNILSVSGNTATVDYTNDTNTLQRGFVTTSTNHRAAVAVFSVDTNNSSANAGNLGFLVDVVKTDASKQTNTSITVDTYDFIAITVSYSKTDQAGSGTKKAGLNAYVSSYKGVATKDANGNSLLDADNNFHDALGNEIKTTENSTTGAKETQQLPTSGTWQNFSSIKADSDGFIKVAVVVTPVAPTTDDEKGSYKVEFYDASNVTTDGKKSDPTSWITTTAKALDNGTVTVSASWTAKKDTAEASLPQSLIGYYSAVQANSTLEGTITLPYIQNEADVIEWEDVQY